MFKILFQNPTILVSLLLCNQQLKYIYIMNEAEQNTSVEDDLQSEESTSLTDLRRKIQLSNVQLLDLAYHDEKFLACIDEYNTNGIEKVQNDELKQALLFFNQNQKILQYAASCGNTIDRSTIIATLHNQACVHQKLWDLEKSANYLQAIIYNINIYLQGLVDKKMDSKYYRPKQKSEYQNITAIAQKKQNFALYQLQFCAVNSQIRKHSISVESAYSAIKVLKETCKLTSLLLTTEDSDPSSFRNRRILENKQMLQKLTALDQNLTPSSYDEYLKKVMWLMSDKIQRSAPLQEECGSLKSFSIGKLMQLSPLKISEIEQKPRIQQWLRYDNILMKVLYLGVSYFTVGTELRFISSQNCEQGSQQYKNTIDFKTSEVYHLYAILIILTYVPLDTIFLSHLVTSFNNHYLIDIQKYANPHFLSNSERFSLQAKNSKGLKQSSPEQQQNINELPQSSQLKNSVKQSINERNSKNGHIKFHINTNSANQNLKKSQTTTASQLDKVPKLQGRTKTTRIKNVEEITVIKKTEEVREEHFKDKIKAKKSPTNKNVSKSNKKIKATILQFHPQKQENKQKKDSEKDAENKEAGLLSSRAKGRTAKEYLNINVKQISNKSKKKIDRQNSVKVIESSKSRKSKNSSNSAKYDNKKVKCIYTVRNKADEELKTKKNSSSSKSKSRPKNKSIKGLKKLAQSGYHINQRASIPPPENKSYMQNFCNDLLNSPRSDEFQQAFKDKAKLISSKAEEERQIGQHRQSMNDMLFQQKPKSRSKMKEKQKIKMKKVFSKIKPLSSK